MGASTDFLLNLRATAHHWQLRGSSQRLVSPLLSQIRATGWKTSFSLAVLISLLTFVVYRIAFHPLSKFPGPFVAKISGHWRNSRYWGGTWHDDIVQAHRKYGRVVRIAPNELSIVDEQVSKQLYGHGHNAPKTSWYSTWDIPGAAAGVFATRDKKLHAFLRKRLTGAYSMTSIVKFEPYIQRCFDMLFYQLKKHADNGDVVDIGDWTNALAYDVVGELAFGEPFGHLEKETDVMGVRKAVYDGFFFMANMGHYPGQMSWIRNPAFQFLLKLAGKEDPLGGFQAWSMENVKRRRDNQVTDQREDLLAHFIKMKTATNEPASFEEVLIEAMNIVGAGADTTSIGMRTCLFYLCRHPESYRKLQNEIDEFYSDNGLTEPITYAQTQKMPYLGAVAKEAMRLLPSIVYQLIRYCPDGQSVDGKAIPSGTPVGISPIAQNRDKAIWGDDADDFRPERWLEGKERTAYLELNNYTFGGNGPRMCIGRNIALVEVHKFVAQLLYNFDVELVDREKPWRITTFWFAYQHDMFAKLHPREGRQLKTPIFNF